MGWFGISIGLGLLVPAAYLLSRHGFRQPPRSPRWLGAFVLGWAWVTWGVEVLGSLGFLDRAALLAWSGAGLAMAVVVRLLRPGPVDSTAPLPASRAGPWATIAVGLVVWAAFRFGLVAVLFPV